MVISIHVVAQSRPNLPYCFLQLFHQSLLTLQAQTHWFFLFEHYSFGFRILLFSALLLPHKNAWLFIFFRMQFGMFNFARFDRMYVRNLLFVFSQLGIVLIFGVAGAGRFGLHSYFGFRFLYLVELGHLILVVLELLAAYLLFPSFLMIVKWNIGWLFWLALTIWFSVWVIYSFFMLAL